MIKNLEKIHPCKRDKVLKALEYLEEANKERTYIYKVVIFVSAVTEHCTDDSDIDVCVYTNLNCKDRGYFNVLGNFCMALDDRSDVLNFNYMSNRLRVTIIKTGVAVYIYAKNVCEEQPSQS